MKVSMDFAFDAEALALPTVMDITRDEVARTITAYHAKIDDKLGDLMGADIHPDRISIEKRPGPMTVIMVDGRAVAEVKLAVSYMDQNILDGMII